MGVSEEGERPSSRAATVLDPLFQPSDIQSGREDNSFLTPIGTDADLNLAFPYVKGAIDRAPLREDGLIFFGVPYPAIITSGTVARAFWSNFKLPVAFKQRTLAGRLICQEEGRWCA